MPWYDVRLRTDSVKQQQHLSLQAAQLGCQGLVAADKIHTARLYRMQLGHGLLALAPELRQVLPLSGAPLLSRVHLGTFCSAQGQQSCFC